jgi:rhodanese-related sulfurtransferase
MTHALFRNGVAHADGFRAVDPQTLHAHLGEARLVDAREPHEFVVCRSGGRSARAARQLVALGFKRVINVRGGMLAYDSASLPVERSS